MKPLYSFLVVFAILIQISSCSKDTSSDQSGEEINFEDFSILKEDTQFLTYVSQTMKASQNVKDPDKALELLEIQESLTEMQQLELATSMGFTDTKSMEDHFNRQTEIWLMISYRFDLKTNAEALENAYQKAVMDWIKTDQGKMYDYQTKNNEECSDLCLSSYYATIIPDEKSLKHFFCDDLCDFGVAPNEQGGTCLECHTSVDFYLTLAEQERLSNLQCCEWWCVEDPEYWEQECKIFRNEH